MSIIKQYHETQKGRTRRLLFVQRYCQAWNDLPKHPHLVLFEAARRFLNDSVSATVTGLWRHYDLTMDEQVLPLLRWFAYEKPFPAEWDTERLTVNAEYYTNKLYIPVDSQKFVMRAVRCKLKQHQKFLEEEAKGAE